MPVVPPQSFPMKQKRAWHIVTAGIGVVLAGVELLRLGRGDTVGWVTIACGLVLVTWFGQPAWRRAPMVWFDDRGLWARMPGFGPLSWQDIERVRFVRVYGKAFLVVDRVPSLRAAKPPSSIARAYARSAEANDLAVPLDNLEAAPDRVAAVVDLAHRHALGRA